jgi:hypothetical protein
MAPAILAAGWLELTEASSPVCLQLSRCQQVELGPVRKAGEGTPGGAKRATPGPSPLAGAAGRAKLAVTPQSGSKARGALRDTNAH